MLPLRAITIVGDVTDDGPKPSGVIAGGFRRAAASREISPLPLEPIRARLLVTRQRLGFFELDVADTSGMKLVASLTPADDDTV